MGWGSKIAVIIALFLIISGIIQINSAMQLRAEVGYPDDLFPDFIHHYGSNGAIKILFGGFLLLFIGLWKS